MSVRTNRSCLVRVFQNQCSNILSGTLAKEHARFCALTSTPAQTPTTKLTPTETLTVHRHLTPTLTETMTPEQTPTTKLTRTPAPTETLTLIQTWKLVHTWTLTLTLRRTLTRRLSPTLTPTLPHSNSDTLNVAQLLREKVSLHLRVHAYMKGLRISWSTRTAACDGDASADAKRDRRNT